MILLADHVVNWIAQRVDESLLAVDHEALRQTIGFLVDRAALLLVVFGLFRFDSRSLVLRYSCTGRHEIVDVHFALGAWLHVMPVVLVL